MAKSSLSIILAAGISVSCFSFTPAQAGDGFAPIVDTAIAYSDAQCMREYRTLHPQALRDSTCFDPHRPFGRCMKLFKTWDDVHALTSKTCLQVIKDVTLNTNTPDFMMNPTTTYKVWKNDWARALLKNKTLMENIDQLEHEELKAAVIK